MSALQTDKMYALTIKILVLLSSFGKPFSVTGRTVSQKISSKDDSGCRMNGRSYRFNTSFNTCSGNRALRCYCATGGIAGCMDLCSDKVAPENCPPGTTLREEAYPVESGENRCSCKRRSCVDAKVLCARREDGQKLKFDDTFTLGNCSQRCRCDENDQISCTPLCSKIKCPKGMRPRSKGLVELDNGCSCQVQDCVPVPRKFCRMEGRRFRRGRVFITKDCTRKCKCRKNGKPRCTPLCKKQKSVPVCRVGERLEELSLLYAGGRCSCTKQFCLRNERTHWTESVSPVSGARLKGTT